MSSFPGLFHASVGILPRHGRPGGSESVLLSIAGQMNARLSAVMKWLARKPLNAWRSLPVRLILIFVASLFVMSAGVTVGIELFPLEAQSDIAARLCLHHVRGPSSAAATWRCGGCFIHWRTYARAPGVSGKGNSTIGFRSDARTNLEGYLSAFNRMADEVQRMLGGQRQLLLSLSHELRTPLTRARLALEFIHDKEVRAHLDYDLSNMERMITELLEGERLNTRNQEMSRSTVNLSKLMAEVMRGDFPNDRHRVSLSLPPAAAHLSVNASRLRMLVRNLVENALGYNPADGPPVEVSLEMEDNTAIIRVEDHGPGIEPQHLEQVTSAFYRANPSRGAGTGRHGLGLYLCRLIAEAHGGSVEVASPPGSGASITARIPGAPPN